MPVKSDTIAWMSTVRYHEHGAPEKVLKVEKNDEVVKMGANQVRLKFLAAPINHADLNMVEGNYSIRPNLPAVGGNEGVAVVTDIGSGVSELSKDDWVIPANAGFGTWRNTAVANVSDLTKVPSTIPVEVAAILSVNPCTAYRLLDDFVDLKPGDVIIQNGANSAVGQAVVQLANARGIKTINILRNRPGYEEVNDHLKKLGGDVVLVEDFFGTHDYRKLVEDLPEPKLALNCIGGKSATNLARALGKGATMVSYGGMSRQPIIVPTGLLIFKDITLRGFWLSEWVKQHSVEERKAMLHEVTKLASDGKLYQWVEKHKFSEFETALQRSKEPFRDRKVVLMME